jgi:hypothetical protein
MIVPQIGNDARPEVFYVFLILINVLFPYVPILLTTLPLFFAPTEKRDIPCVCDTFRLETLAEDVDLAPRIPAGGNEDLVAVEDVCAMGEGEAARGRLG